MIWYETTCGFFRKYWVQILSTAISALCMMSDGMQFAWISPAVKKLQGKDSIIPLTKSEAEWVGQIYLLGCPLGGLLSLLIFNRVSRRLSLIITTMPISLAWILTLLAKSTTVLYIARFVGGIGTNMMFVSVPMYIGEIAHPNIRGAMGTLVYMQIYLGMTIAYAVTPYFALYVPCYIALGFTATQICLMKFLPESPYYLLSIGQDDLCRKNLQILRRQSDVQEELTSLKIAVENQTKDKGNIFSLFTKRSNLKALCVLCFLRSAQEFSGTGVMVMNTITIFGGVGGNISPELSSIIFSLIMLSSGVLVIGFMDRFERKTMMIFSCLIAAMALFAEGAYFYFRLETDYNTDAVNWLPIVASFVFIYGFRAGLGTVPIVMISELLSVDVKATGAAITDVACTTSIFITNSIFYATESKFGMYVPFWVFGCCCIVTAAFSLFIPDTRGKTLEEIQECLNKGAKEKKLPKA